MKERLFKVGERVKHLLTGETLLVLNQEGEGYMWGNPYKCRKQNYDIKYFYEEELIKTEN